MTPQDRQHKKDSEKGVEAVYESLRQSNQITMSGYDLPGELPSAALLSAPRR